MDIKLLTKSIRRHLDLSTAHVTKNDMDLLHAAESGGTSSMSCCSYAEGVIIFVLHFHDDPETQSQYLADMREETYSVAMVTLINLAWSLDVDMIRLDRDGGVVEGLETFSW